MTLEEAQEYQTILDLDPVNVEDVIKNEQQAQRRAKILEDTAYAELKFDSIKKDYKELFAKGAIIGSFDDFVKERIAFDTKTPEQE